MSDLSDDRLTRRYNGLLAALDTIVDHWHGAHHPPMPAGHTGRRTPPRSKPPIDPSLLSDLDAAWRDLRSWSQLVMEERDLTLGPRGNEGPDLALFLARHADWLSRHEAAEDARAELSRHARRIEATAKGRRTRRLTIGSCPEHLIVEEYTTPSIVRCTGTLLAVVHDEDDLLPAVVRCDTDREHTWAPGEWQALGRRLGRTSQDGVESLAAAIIGRPVVTHRA